MEAAREQFLWTERYRPKTLAQCVLPADLVLTFQGFIDQGNIPNLLLTGRAGIGKTTVARALCDQLEVDLLIINGSDEGRSIDVLRNQIRTFASSVSFSEGRKYVLIDEADYLNPNSIQPALRAFMEEFAKNCGFILTCNFKNKLIEPLHSRLAVVEFKIPSAEKATIAAKYHKRVMEILKLEKIDADPKIIAEVVKRYFPDFRKVLNELQRATSGGDKAITPAILGAHHDELYKDIIAAIVKKDFTAARKWVGTHDDIDTSQIYRTIYDKLHEFVKPDSVPQAILTLGEYQYKQAFVADSQINLMACFIELMGLDFK